MPIFFSFTLILSVFFFAGVQGTDKEEITFCPLDPKGPITIYGGQTIEVGQLHVTFFKDYFTLEVDLTDGWTTKELHLNVACSSLFAADPRLARTPGKATLIDGTKGLEEFAPGYDNWQKTLPIPDCAKDCTNEFFIILHLVVDHPSRSSETAYASGPISFRDPDSQKGGAWGWEVPLSNPCTKCPYNPPGESTPVEREEECCACPCDESGHHHASYFDVTCGGEIVAGGSAKYVDGGCIQLESGNVHQGAPTATLTSGSTTKEVNFAQPLDVSICSVTCSSGTSPLSATFSQDCTFNLHTPVGCGACTGPRGPALPQLPSSGCTYTIGYWKNHHSGSKNPSQQIEWPGNHEASTLCSQTWMSVLEEPVFRRAWYILAKQWIGATLNVAGGASNTAIAQELADASSLLQTNCNDWNFSDSASSAAGHRAKAIELGMKLDEFNNGIIGPGHCDGKSNGETEQCPCRCST